MRWGISYMLPRDRQLWATGAAGRGKSWVMIVEAATEEEATRLYGALSADSKPVIAVPLDQRIAA